MDPRETHKRDENYWKTRMGLPADEGNVGAGSSAPAPAPVGTAPPPPRTRPPPAPRPPSAPLLAPPEVRRHRPPTCC